jgi:hypothetical protein
MRQFSIIAGIVVAIGCLIAVRGCVSERDPRDFGRGVAEAFASSVSNGVARSVSVAQDLSYTVAAFRRRQDRWPKDYEELRGFVQQSDGYLVLGGYSSVALTNLPADRLEIRFVPEGQTNPTTLTLEPPRRP